MVAAAVMVAWSATSCGASSNDLATFSAQTQMVRAEQSTSEAGTAQAETATAQARRAATETAQHALTSTAEGEKWSTATALAGRRATNTAAAVSATALAGGLYEQVQALAEEGYLDSTTGKYYQVDDFSQSWAQLKWYQWWLTDYSPADFVIRAHTEWESASETADWWSSGCGFVFRVQEDEDHYGVFLGLDGWVNLWRMSHGDFVRLGTSYYGSVDLPSGEADVMLVAVGDVMTYFVNGRDVHSRPDSVLSSGALGLTLVSGTNKDFGTRCKMTDIELWILD
jgi:hypothetical protein